jgi:hypothetical protein
MLVIAQPESNVNLAYPTKRNLATSHWLLLCIGGFPQQLQGKPSLFLFFLVVDNGKTPSTHHLPKQNPTDRFFYSAFDLGCRLVVQSATSSR